MQKKGIPWGPFSSPFHLNLNGIKISMEKNDNLHTYRRESGGETVDKVILSGTGILRLSPVEPLPKPSGLSAHLLIDFARPVVMEPRIEKNIYTLFPLEIAAIIEHRRKETSMLDQFSLNKVKYALYGSVKDGLICRYWQSDIYQNIPEADPSAQGVLRITIQNSTAKWVEVNEAVFSAYGMKVYYSPNLVALNTVMKITGDMTAETVISDKPLKVGMHEAWRQYSPKPLSQQGRVLMEEGY
ncbi:MAG TPA: DUF432 domain-containing protein [Firmicutes bacterium]|nr:DUF432 domain-containing protein [Bacillota bacterium]